ncbi:lipid II flippase MurJ [subsurface metagenome]
MTLTKKVALNALIQTIGKVLYFGFSLAIIMLITRHLGVSGYGNYNTIIAYLGIFAVLADLGLYMIMVRDMSQRPKEQEKIVGNVLGLRIFTAIVALILAALVSIFLNYPLEVKIGILIFSAGIFFILLSQTLLGVFQVYLRVDKATIAEVAGRFLTLILVIWLIKKGAGLLPVITAAAAGFAFNFFLSFIFANQFIKIIPRFQISLWKKTIIKALPLGIVAILATIYYKIDIVLLSLLPLKKVLIFGISHFSNSEAVGIYSAAYRVLEIIVVFPNLFALLIFPIISKSIKSDPKRTQRVFQKSFNFLAIFGIFFTIIGFFLASQITDIVGGREFANSKIVLQILSIAFLPHFVGNLYGIVLTAADKQKVLIMPFFIFTAFNIIGNLILIPYYSFLGAALITVVGQFILCSVNYYLIWKHVKLAPSVKILPNILLAGTVVAGFLMLILRANFFALDNFYLFPIWQKMFLTTGLIMAVSAVYFMLLYLFGGVTKKDLISLRR